MAFPFSLYSFSLYTFSLILLLSRVSHAQTPPALFVFGDSLADVGNNNYLLLSLAKANYPQNGIDFAGRQATGRFSNGRVLPDFIAEKLGLPSPPPYLSIESNIFLSSAAKADRFLRGVSFASGGAGILSTTNQGQCISMDTQVDYFSRVQAALLGKLGSAALQQLLSKSIFLVVIGSNDLFGYSSGPSSAQTFVDSLLSKLAGQLKRIYDLGARKIAFPGIGPLGCTPSQRRSVANKDCNADSNSLAVKFNEGLLARFKEAKNLANDFSYSFYDSYAAFTEVLASPATYGFKEIKSACCGFGDLNAVVPCLPITPVCSNRLEYFFWDFTHPIEAAASKLSDQIFDGAPPRAFPINVRQLASL